MKKLSIGVAVLALVAGAFFFWRVRAANPAFPQSAELDAVDLTIPEVTKPSQAMEQFLKTPTDALTARQLNDYERWVQTMKSGQWFADPLGASDDLRTLAPWLEKAETAMISDGCFPQPRYEIDKDGPYFYLNLLRAMRLLSVREIVRAQLGDGDAAVGRLARIQDRLLDREARCAISLIEAMILKAGFSALHRAWGYLLAIAPLRRESAVQAWRRVMALETRSTVLPMAIRGEAKASLRFLRRNLKKDLAKDGLEEGLSFSQEDTLRMATQIYKWAGLACESRPWHNNVARAFSGGTLSERPRRRPMELQNAARQQRRQSPARNFAAFLPPVWAAMVPGKMSVGLGPASLA